MRRFQSVLTLMQMTMPNTHIIIQGLYPRGADFGDGSLVWPNNYTYALSLVNARYEVCPSRASSCLPSDRAYAVLERHSAHFYGFPLMLYSTSTLCQILLAPSTCCAAV
jgi:hypothetical protein